jgi:hypothetical protein
VGRRSRHRHHARRGADNDHSTCSSSTRTCASNNGSVWGCELCEQISEFHRDSSGHLLQRQPQTTEVESFWTCPCCHSIQIFYLYRKERESVE